MKLKQRPEDFQVEELTDRVAGEVGAFGFYRLEKEGWGTPEALQAIRRRWKLDLRRVSYGGLKDRHARTVQYLTIHQGPRRDLTHHGVQLSYLGQTTAPFSSRDVRANRFQITLRSLHQKERARIEVNLDDVREQGVPNYFDDQRFGSVGAGGEFVARAMIRGDFERALWLALVEPYEHDRGEQKREKAILQSHWRDWPTCKQQLPRGHARSLVDYLVHHPEDFRRAVARLRPDLQGLYLSAYQSHVWNRMLSAWLVEHCRAEQRVLVRLRLGDVPMHHRLTADQQAELAALSLPLPSARLKMDASDPLRPLIDAVLADEGLRLEEMKIKGMREPFFSKGERSALCMPADLRAQSADDDRNLCCEKLTLHFDLSRGSYATMIVKRLTAGLSE